MSLFNDNLILQAYFLPGTASRRQSQTVSILCDNNYLANGTVTVSDAVTTENWKLETSVDNTRST